MFIKILSTYTVLKKILQDNVIETINYKILREK